MSLGAFALHTLSLLSYRAECDNDKRLALGPGAVRVCRDRFRLEFHGAR